MQIFRSRYSGPILLSTVATLTVLLTLGPGRGGPGVTCDELYHVAYGKRLLSAIRHEGPAFFHPQHVAKNFDWRPDGPPVHPPLGNLLLAIGHHLLDFEPDNPASIVLAAARIVPAIAFGLLVLAVGLFVARHDGQLAGTVAAAAVALMPRVFGHAHLAALDTLTSLTFVLALLTIVEAALAGGRWPIVALAGVLWGLAMLTRLHGGLVGPPVAVWLLARYRRSGLRMLLIWSAAAGAVFFVGWPWLWLDPWGHSLQFLSTGVARQPIQVFYLGQAWDDRAVPWHYPWVMFVVTIPVGLLALGLVGIVATFHKAATGGRGSGAGANSANENPLAIPEPRPPVAAFFCCVLGFVLALFSWPGVPVYDGVRLFLMAFPLWAILVGRAAAWLVEHRLWQSWPRRGRVLAIGAVIGVQSVGILAYHPFTLSYYNLLVGGLWGADRMGLETTYWGDAVDERLLEATAACAAGETVLYAPNLAPFQSPAVVLSSSSLLEARVNLVGWDQAIASPPPGCRFALVYRRKANMGSLPQWLLNGRVVDETQRQGVWLARLLEITQDYRKGGGTSLSGAKGVVAIPRGFATPFTPLWDVPP